MFNQSKNSDRLYFLISLSIAFYYGICFYYFVFSQEYIVQDDVRQHIVWLQRFSDPELFSQDIIAEYFYSLAPLGFKTLYVSLAKIGIEPLLLAKLLPPLLGIVTTIYTYRFTLKILPVPLAGCLSSLFINQLIWLNDDLVSATHRAFIYPLFAAFLYYLADKKIIPCLVIMLLQGLFYPHILLIEMIVLSIRLLSFKNIHSSIVRTKINVQQNIFSFRVKKIHYRLPKTALTALTALTVLTVDSFKITKKIEPYVWWIGGLIVTAIALYPITQKPPELATTVTAVQMQQMPEFNPGGRSVFFSDRWFQYWFAGSSGLSLPLFPTVVWLGVALPWMLKLKLSINKSVTNKVNILLQVTVTSFIMFAAAHILLPKLHLPSRYTYHTLRFILAISTGIVLTVLWDLTKRWLRQKKRFNLADKIKMMLVAIMAIAVIIVPAIPFVFTNWFQNWRIGTAPEIYQYLARQPKDTLVASLSEEANNIPAFSQRSILVGREFAMAYHPSYHAQVRQRAVDLLQAQYSQDIAEVRSFITRYGIDYWLIDRNAFQPEYLRSIDWLVNSSWKEETNKIIRQSKISSDYLLSELIPSCSIVSTTSLDLLESNCILDFRQSQHE
ncbi:MAG: hypothetical protein AAGE96_24005 [Cyanobacteria bacterium P01_G01_bin.19]